MAKISSVNGKKNAIILNFFSKSLDFFMPVCYNGIVDTDNLILLILADMAELADAYGSGPYESDFMQVRPLLSAPS